MSEDDINIALLLAACWVVVFVVLTLYHWAA